MVVFVVVVVLVCPDVPSACDEPNDTARNSAPEESAENGNGCPFSFLARVFPKVAIFVAAAEEIERDALASVRPDDHDGNSDPPRGQGAKHRHCGRGVRRGRIVTAAP